MTGPRYAAYKTEYTFETEAELENLSFDLGVENRVVGEETVPYNHTAAVKDGKLAMYAANNDTTYISGFDGGNNNLQDYIVKWDITDDSHAWSTDSIYFRRQDKDHYYRLYIQERGASSATASYDTYKYTYLAIAKKDGGDEVILAQYPIGTGLMDGITMTIKAEFIGNTFKAWFSNAGYDMKEPVLTYTDEDAFVGGTLMYGHAKDNDGQYTYIDNFTIYDLTAKAFADDVDAAADGLTRAEGRALEVDYKALHSAQVAKLADAIAVYNDSVVTAIAANEFNAMKANGDEVVDICDLVALDVAVDAEGTLAADPEFDGVTDGKDLTALRKFLLGIKHY